MPPTIKVLTVDDDARNLRILDEILSEEFRIEHATNGPDALDKARTFKPDIILLDIMMPGMDGLEVCRRLRADPSMQFVKIILVSGKARLEERLQGYDAGADDYVTKPFDHDELHAKVRVYARLKAAEEVDRTKTDFLNLITHETNTPLHNILSLARLLRDDPALPDSLRQLSKELMTCTLALQEKTSRLLLLSRLRTHGSKEQEVPVLAGDWLRESLEKVRSTAEENYVTLTLNPAEGTIPGHYELLKTALFMVLENAVKYSPAGGAVTVCARRDDAAAMMHVEVTDLGPGIAHNTHHEIFNAFYCTDVTHHGSGMGISLTLCRLIIEMHGGSVQAANRDGGGAVFTLSLPATP